MEYIKDILPENNWNIVQSPGNGHCLVYSTMIVFPVLLYFLLSTVVSYSLHTLGLQSQIRGV